MIISTERLKEILHYSPSTGIFTWKTGVSNMMAGDIAGSVTSKGYIQIKVDKSLCQAHRLAFLYMNGKLPADQVDHINRNTTDNRWVNLREVTIRQNHENRKDNAKFIGVAWHKNISRWVARTPRVSGMQKHIGTFKTHFAACYARHAWELK